MRKLYVLELHNTSNIFIISVRAVVREYLIAELERMPNFNCHEFDQVDAL